MTPPASTICCAGCGSVPGPADPYPFRCPRAGTDDADHVLTRVLNLPSSASLLPPTPSPSPALPTPPPSPTRIPSSSTAPSCTRTTWPAARGLPDGAYRDLVASLDAAVAAVDGHGFRATPFSRSPDLSDALGFDGDGGVWVKDETGNVSGSHKGRHLMGVLIHLAVMERCGLTDPARRRDLAIASCGNAALAAAVVARAGGWALTVFVPPEADPRSSGGCMTSARRWSPARASPAFPATPPTTGCARNWTPVRCRSPPRARRTAWPSRAA